MKRFNARRYYQWLGQLHGTQKRFSQRKYCPKHICDAYWQGWYAGRSSVTQ